MAALEPSAFDEWSARPTLPKRSQGLRRHRSDIRVAILGLPNSGKTGLFNSLTGLSAPVDDAAFSTREAQTGVARVDDPRFAWLCEHFEPDDAVPCRVRVVDTPALVAGSADNRGLGCDDVRQHAGGADVLLLVVRAFGGEDVTQVEGNTVNPLRDVDTLMAELLKIDQQTASREYHPLETQVEKKQGGTALAADCAAMQKVHEYLETEKKPLRDKEDWQDQEIHMIQKCRLLTAKEVIVVVNLEARDYLRPPSVHAGPGSIVGRVRARAVDWYGGPLVVPYSGSFEQRLRDLQTSDGDAAVKAYAAANPTHMSARNSILRHCFWSLDLLHFFTCGPEEVRAWTMVRGGRAPAAAGTINQAFEEGFLSVEVESFLDLYELGSEGEVKREGKLTQQGNRYVIQDGDICFFRFKLPNYKVWRG